MIAQVLLLRPSGRSSESNIFAMEQLGLSYLAAYARSRGLTVRIVDGYLDPAAYEDLFQTARPDDYAVIGYPVYQETVSRVAKDVLRLKNAGLKSHFTVGNHLATLCPEELLSEFKQFDSAIRGEGEVTITELAIAMSGEENLSGILGLVYRDGESIVSNPPRPNLDDLDGLPFPVRDTLPLVIRAGNTALLYSSRGCNARCVFCSVHKYFNASPNGGWRGRSPSNIVDEMELVASEYGVNEFAFADEQFMGHGPSGTKRAIGIANEIIRRNLKFRWYIETRSSDVTREVFQSLHDGGLRAVFMGVESGYDPALKGLKKGLRVVNHLHAIETLSDLGIIASIGFIMFRPETTIDELLHNLDFLETIGCGEITALTTRLRVYAGTNLTINMRAAGTLQGSYRLQDWSFLDLAIQNCYDIAIESADVMSVCYNEFARIRRTGLLTFSEAAKLQRTMNSRLISVLRQAVSDVAVSGALPPSRMMSVRQLFVDVCDELLRVMRFTECVVRRRTPLDGVRLLNPMSLC